MMNILRPKLKLVKGTRFVSFLFIGCSILIAAGILFAANMYYNIDTGEIVMEEIQRTTGLIRAVGGVIIGGTDTDTLPSGVAFEVATSSAFGTSDVLLSGADQVLRFSGNTNFYVGLKATTSLATTTVWTLPAADGSSGNVLITDGNKVLGWSSVSGIGAITAVGNIDDGDAFTTTTPGQWLWFGQSGSDSGKLNVATLSGTSTAWTLPALTGTIALTSGDLGSNGVLFANSGLIATSTDFTWSTSSRALSLGSNGNAGQLRIYSGNSTNYLGFSATSTMTGNTEYYWPDAYGTTDFVLTTDGSGQLLWKSVEGVGGITGSGQAGRVTFWTGENTLGNSASFTWSTSTNKLTLGGGLVVPLIEYAGDLTLQTSGAGNDIILAPASGIVKLSGAGTYIETASGYRIGATGTQVLREMIPILGFDLPAQTATTSYVKISKDLENYPFQSAATGTTRVHKLVFRYAASSTNLIDWRISTSTGQTYSSSTLATTTSNNLEKGNAYVTTTTIPIDGTDWWLDIKTSAASDVVRVFQIFLAAYDQVQ